MVFFRRRAACDDQFDTCDTTFGLILLLCVLAGIGVSAAHVIPWSIIPDAIEYGELKNRQAT